MKKIFLYYALLLGLSIAARGQTICSTPEQVPNFLETIPPQQFATPSDNYVLRVYAHIIRRSNGTGGQTQAAVIQGLNIAAADFLPHGICISLLGIDEIWNDTYYNMSNFSIDNNGDGKFDNFSPNSHSNAIDLYLLGTDGNMQGGVAANIVATSLALGGVFSGINLVSSHILSHEMGHCIGLYHTFHGMCEGGCRELVNGSNCTSCGDFVCDTRPDPQTFSTNANCSWNGANCGIGSTDANGAPYNPATNLIMAYVPPNCMQLFTTGQGTRMRTAIANSALLQGIIVPNTLTLSSLTVGSGVTALYDVLNYLTAQSSVAVQSGGSLTLRAGVEVVLANGFSAAPGAAFRAYIDETCSTTDQNNSARQVITKNSPVNDTEAVLQPGIYPNPVNNTLNVVVPAKAPGTIVLKIISASGVMMSSSKHAVVKGSQRILLDVSKLSPGLYVIQVLNGSHIMSTHKFIKAQ